MAYFNFADFELALKIEPGNKAITDELNKLPKVSIFLNNNNNKKYNLDSLSFLFFLY